MTFWPDDNTCNQRGRDLGTGEDNTPVQQARTLLRSCIRPRLGPAGGTVRDGEHPAEPPRPALRLDPPSPRGGVRDRHFEKMIQITRLENGAGRKSRSRSILGVRPSDIFNDSSSSRLKYPHYFSWPTTYPKNRRSFGSYSQAY